MTFPWIDELIWGELAVGVFIKTVETFVEVEEEGGCRFCVRLG